MENNIPNEIENKNKGSKRPYVIAVCLALVLVIMITATSYAYFTATITNATNPTATSVTTGSLGLEFTDGAEVGLENATPGSYIEKTFSIKNTGNTDTVYDIYLSDLVNDFEDKSDLVYTLTSSNGANVSETQVPDVSSKIVSNQQIGLNETHNYTLRIEFKETNDVQDDNANKQFSAVIRINEVEEATPTAAETIMSLANDVDSSSTDVIGTTGLAYDGTADNNLRYVGSNPNNYVSFNNELWRIIGVMNNIETESGQTKSLLKIRRAKSLGNYSWDTTTSDINVGQGINQWGASNGYEGADLMRELNYDYLGNVQVGTDGKWFNGNNNSKTADMPTSTLSQASQAMIESVVWNLGSPSNDNGSYDSNWTGVKAPTSYTRERANTNGKVCTRGSYCTDSVTRTSSWTGKVGLFYPSDYLYATSGGTTTNRNTCLTTPMNSWDNSAKTDCKSNDWLYDSSRDQWTMSPFAISSSADIVFIVYNTYGHVNYYNADGANYVSPVVFLKSNISITGGDGSWTSPYTLG